jgi:hypothetical protein
MFRGTALRNLAGENRGGDTRPDRMGGTARFTNISKLPRLL